MSEIKLHTKGAPPAELTVKSVAFEKSLQNLVGTHLEFLATEHSTGKVHGGRIDTLGVDQHCCPVIIVSTEAA